MTPTLGVVDAAAAGATVGFAIFALTFVALHVGNYRSRLRADATHREGVPAYLRYALIHETDWLRAAYMAVSLSLGCALLFVVALTVATGVVVTFGPFL